MNLFQKLFHRLTDTEKHEKLIRHLSSDIYLQCFYNRISERDDVAKYLYDKLSDIIRTEYDVPIYEVSIALLNRRETDRTEWACGTYLHRKDKTQVECKELNARQLWAWSDEIADNPDKILDITAPHIEVSNENSYESRLLILAHELGHHMIELEGRPQSEQEADANVIRIFQTHFHPAFTGIYHAALSVYDTNFKIADFKEHYLMHYLDYLNGDNELNLKQYA